MKDKKRTFCIRTHKGVFLVHDCDNWNDACNRARMSSAVDPDKCIEMLGSFADEVRYTQQLMTTGIVITEPDVLKKAIELYADARISDQMKGGGDPESFPEIEQNLNEARSLLKDITGLELP